MNQQPLNLRRSIEIVRRYRVLVGIVVALGAFGGLGYAALTPPMLTTQALVIIPAPKPGIATQETIAEARRCSPPRLPSSVPRCHFRHSSPGSPSVP